MQRTLIKHKGEKNLGSYSALLNEKCPDVQQGCLNHGVDEKCTDEHVIEARHVQLLHIEMIIILNFATVLFGFIVFLVYLL